MFPDLTPELAGKGSLPVAYRVPQQEWLYHSRCGFFYCGHQVDGFMRIHSCSRLIKKEKPWIRGQRSCDFYSTLITIRKFYCRFIYKVLKVHYLSEFHGFLGDFFFTAVKTRQIAYGCQKNLCQGAYEAQPLYYPKQKDYQKALCFEKSWQFRF